MSAVLARLRASATLLVLLAALTAVSAALVVGGPRLVNGRTDSSLRERVEPLAWSVRDVTFEEGARAGASTPDNAPGRLRSLASSLEPGLRDIVERSWWQIQADPEATATAESGLPTRTVFGIHAIGDWEHEVEVVDGRLPTSAGRFDDDLPRVEVAVSDRTASSFDAACADACDFGVGTTFEIRPALNPDATARVEVVGIVALAESPTWEIDPLLREGSVPVNDGDPYAAAFLTDQRGASILAGEVPLTYSWRFRVDGDRLRLSEVDGLRDAVAAARADPDYRVETLLDAVLSDFADQVRGAWALLAVVPAGVLAVLLGLAALASRLAVRRREDELRLLRARGASLAGLARHTGSESVPVVLLGATLGVLTGLLVPGRSSSDWWLVGLVVLVTGLAVPVFAVAAGRRLHGDGAREDIGVRVGPVRRVVEASVVVVALLGLLLLRRRGLSEAGGVDLFLAATPVLLALAAAIVLLRLVPFPLSWSGRATAHRAGLVGFLGLARSARSASVVLGPVAVLVLATAVATFSAVVSGAVEKSRDVAAAADLVGDLTVSGQSFDPATTAEIAALPGVESVASFTLVPSVEVFPEGETRVGRSALQLAVDAPALVGVAADAGRSVTVPDELVDADPTGGDLLPALVSPRVHERLDGAATISTRVRGDAVEFRVAGVVETFPGLPRTAADFVVLPAQHLEVPGGGALAPTGFVIAGDPDHDALAEVAQAGYRSWLEGIGLSSEGATSVLSVLSYDERRAELERGGLNDVVSAVYVLGAVGGALLALLAVGFAVLAGARQRGRVLSRLRTLGLTRAQGRWLLVVELAPLIALGVVAGAALGLVLPALLAPVLELASFADGQPVRIGVDLVVVVGVVALVLAGLGVAMTVEVLFNRRQRLGQALRLGTAE